MRSSAGRAARIAPRCWGMSARFIFNERNLHDYPNVQRLIAEISARPAAIRALAVKAQHMTPTQMDDLARRAMFPQNVG